MSNTVKRKRIVWHETVMKTDKHKSTVCNVLWNYKFRSISTEMHKLMVATSDANLMRLFAYFLKSYLLCVDSTFMHFETLNNLWTILILMTRNKSYSIRQLEKCGPFIKQILDLNSCDLNKWFSFEKRNISYHSYHRILLFYQFINSLVLAILSLFLLYRQGQ